MSVAKLPDVVGILKMFLWFAGTGDRVGLLRVPIASHPPIQFPKLQFDLSFPDTKPSLLHTISDM